MPLAEAVPVRRPRPHDQGHATQPEATQNLPDVPLAGEVAGQVAARRAGQVAAKLADGAQRTAVCSATIPPVRSRQLTEPQPAALMRRARAGWSGHARIDSAR